MARTSIKLTLDFEGMLEAIKDAGGDIEQAAMKTATKCAEAMRDELVSECNASDVSASVSGAIEHRVNATSGGNMYEVEAGWKLGDYDPKNPSPGYEAVFLNYGTARRTTKTRAVHQNIGGKWVTLGTDRGKITARGFIGRAKKNASKKVKKIQKEALKEMLRELT